MKLPWRLAWKKSRFFALILIVFSTAGHPEFMRSQSTRSAPVAATPQRTFLNQYCVACHNDQAKVAGLLLDKMDVARVGADAETWEKVVRKLRAGMMPPSGAKHPDKATAEGFVSWLENELDRSASTRPDFGSPGIHRLNRAEYANVIRDLLAVDVDVSALLPQDDSSFGFDNIASSLGVSSSLLEAYLAAASKISRIAIGDTAVAPNQKTYVAPSDLSQNEHVEGLPFGTRGGMLIHHTFPVDGEYSFQLALLRGTSEELYGRSSKNEQMELSIDGQQVKLFDIDKEEADRTRKVDGVTPPLEVRTQVTAGMHSVGVAFVKKNYAAVEDIFSSTRLRSSISVLDVSRSVVPHISSVAIGGPYKITGVSETASRRQIFTCRPPSVDAETRCAEQILSTLARRAF